MALYDPLDKHTFRHNLAPLDNEALDIGIPGRRFATVRAATLVVDTATVLAVTGSVVSATSRLVMPAGNAGAPGLSSATSATSGFFDLDGSTWGWTSGGFVRAGFSNSTAFIMSTNAPQIGWSGNSAIDNINGGVLTQGSASTWAFQNLTNGCTLSVQGTTTGNRRLTLSHDGTNAFVDNPGAVGNLTLGAGATDLKWGKALIALGGGAGPTFGTIGGSGPATAAQNSWMRVLDSTGAAFWVPAWK